MNKEQDFLKKIFEGLNKPALISWNKKQNKWVGKFSIETIEYEIFIKNFSKKQRHFLFKFTADNSFNLKNDLKKAFTVIPTIDKAAENFIKETMPEAFLFCALDSSTSRKIFYDRFCNKIRRKYKYNYESKISGDYEFYILAQKNVDVNDLNNTINKIIKTNK